MEVSERQIEAGAAVVEAEQADAIARIHAELLAEGEPDCIDCGEPIPAKRRAALPSARRCIACQTTFEKGPL